MTMIPNTGRLTNVAPGIATCEVNTPNGWHRCGVIVETVPGVSVLAYRYHEDESKRFDMGPESGVDDAFQWVMGDFLDVRSVAPNVIAGPWGGGDGLGS